MGVRRLAIGALAAVLVALAAFGLGTTDKTDARFQGAFITCNPYAPQTSAIFNCVYLVHEHGIDSEETAVPRPGCNSARDATVLVPDEFAMVHPVGESFLICVNTSEENRAYSKLTFDSNGVGRFDRAACGYQGSNSDGDARVAEWPDDACLAVSGNNTSQLVIEQSINGLTNDLGTVIIRYTCPATPARTKVVITHSEGGPGNTATGAPGTTFDHEVNVECRGLVTALTPTARPATVEIIPARSNTSHALITTVLTGAAGSLPANTEVQWTTNRCRIEAFGFSGAADFSFPGLLNRALALNAAAPATYLEFEFVAGAIVRDLQDSSDPAVERDRTPLVDAASSFDFPAAGLPGNQVLAVALLACNPLAAPDVTPGVATVTICADVPGPDVCTTTQVTVIGPPAAITVTAAPATVRCGERVTLTATVRDSIGQNVSDHTRVEFTTNLGGVLTGTGAVAGFAGPVVPISSTVGETFGGIATAFLLTSEKHSGPYEIVVTSGGTVASDPAFSWFAWATRDLDEIHASAITNVLGGVFSTPPVNAFAQVACTVPAAAPAAPTVTAPTTGGGIVPPSTGDAGLAKSGGMSLMPLAIAGAIAAAIGATGLRALRR